MKVSSLALAALSLLANPDGAVASSSPADAPELTSRKNKFLPWTKTRFYNPIGGETAAGAESEGRVLYGRDVSIPLSQASTLSANDAPLMRDIEMLTEILSDLVRHENPKVHELCEEFFGYGQQR